MHLYFYARGKIAQVDEWKPFMQTVMWKWIRRDLKTGKDKTVLVQGALRPSVLGAWEYIFPEECLPEVLAHMGVIENNYGFDGKKSRGIKLAFLRRIFGCKKIPKKIWEEASKVISSITIKESWRGISAINIPGVSIHIIGIKKDKRMDFEKAGYNQEML